MDIPELIRKEGLRRGLSHKTIKTYRQCVKKFFMQCPKDPKEIKKQDIKDYLDKMIEKGSCGNTINVNLNALKFLYGQILNKRLMLRIKFSKTPKTKPVFLSKEEVLRLIDAIKNPKHRLMVKLIYSAGLRVNELVSLKPEHFDFKNNYGWVRKGKGNKDRMFMIAESLKKELAEHIAKYCSNDSVYLFRGNNGHITTATMRAIVKKAAKAAGIKKSVHPHTLRHSFSTHLIENGCDVASVQSLLGHASAETTMTYVHMASPKMISIKSPLDSIQIK